MKEMTFEINKASDWSFKENVEINTMEDLKRLAEKYLDENGNCSRLIVDFLCGPSITIYDNYIE